MKFVLCDDNENFLTRFQHALIDQCALMDWDYSSMLFQWPQELLESDLSGAHVLFLDIDMPKVTGMDVAKALRLKYPDLIIVFVTAYLEYAPAGYQVNAFRYLLKQNLKEELKSCLTDIWKRLYMDEDSIQVSLDGHTEDIRLRDIPYFEGTSHRHVKLHYMDGSIKECIGQLSGFEETLKGKDFLRVHKSYLVNLWHISDIKSYLAFLDNGEKINVSEKNYKEICNQFLLWKGERV